ncbi:hypothetical protein [Psychrobacter proteolyticus]|uniref:Uncharacterized protein n=1 Tax=Psychrobacter proteolyticus TaxID=147825 RepID=A0ABV0D639_9GAMM
MSCARLYNATNLPTAIIWSEVDRKVQVAQGQVIKEPCLWLFGYGNWAGPGSAMLVVAERSARGNVPALLNFLRT